jgi:hypothetical protein
MERYILARPAMMMVAGRLNILGLPNKAKITAPVCTMLYGIMARRCSTPVFCQGMRLHLMTSMPKKSIISKSIEPMSLNLDTT